MNTAKSKPLIALSVTTYFIALVGFLIVPLGCGVNDTESDFESIFVSWRGDGSGSWG